MKDLTPTRRRFSAFLKYALAIAIMTCVFLEIGRGQGNTGGASPLAATGGAPAGSYALSDFDNVNLFNGNLNFRLPLLSIGGRGGAEHIVSLPVEKKWIAQSYFNPGTGMNAWYFTDSQPGVLVPKYSPGVVHGYYGLFYPETCPANNQQYYLYTLTKLVFTAPDGTEYELLDTNNSGNVATMQVCNPTRYNRGRVFRSNDGSGVTFVSDTDLVDYYLGPDPSFPFLPDGYLLLPDGTRMRVDAGNVSWKRDRNGNRITFGYDPYGRLSAVTDPLGRQVVINHAVNDDAPYGTSDQIVYQGSGGAQRIIRVSYSDLSSALRTTQPGDPQSGQTCTGLASGTYNPTVVSSVWLPDGLRRYRLFYNCFGELARVVLPTGGAFEYDHGGGLEGSPDGVFSKYSAEGGEYPQVYRRVLERRVYRDGTTLAGKMTYGRQEVYNPSTLAITNRGYVEVDQRDSGGSLITRDRHYFLGSASPSLNESPFYQPTDWGSPKEWKTELLGGNGSDVLSQVTHTWVAGAVFGQGPHISETRQKLVGTNQVAKQTFSYDQYNNRTDVWEYDYGQGDAGPLVRHAQTAYVTTNNGTAYDTLNYNGAALDINATYYLRSLPERQSVYDAAGGERARTVYEYDNYNSNANHAPLVDRPGITGLCNTVDAQYICALSSPTSYTARGNVTAVTGYADAGGQNGAVSTYAQYDVAGNVVKAIDGRGKASQMGYADSFSDLNNSRNTYALATSSTSAVPDPTLEHGTNTPLTSSTVYDFSTGAVTSSTDANDRTTTLSYADESGTPDPLDRLRKVTHPDGGRTRYEYSDSVGDLYLKTLTDLDASRSVESRQYFDGLGRKTRSFIYDGTSPNPWSVADAYYDALGRVSKVSNPYRTASAVGAVPANCSVCTTTTYDALGRALTVTTPDGAQVSTAYDGARVLVTDQAGRQRLSQSDGIGRLTGVWEIRSSDTATVAVSFPNRPEVAAGYLTSYSYDALGNLRKVDQGGQLRYFMYDSLSRLVRARNPEQAINLGISVTDTYTAPGDAGPNSQWSMAYDYDANGNLWHRTDARGVTTTYQYDAIDRLVRTDYSDGTPYTQNTYDFATNGRGRFYSDSVAGASGAQNIVTAYDSAGLPTDRSTLFYVGGAGWTGGYNGSRAYDLAGNVTSETYPSGHTVTYSYDAAGRLGDNGTNPAFKGNLGDGTLRTYSSNVTYDEAGRMREERFGTATPLYHKLHYNVRGQLFDVRLSSVAWGSQNGEWNWNRGALLNYYSQAEINASTNEGHALSGVENNGNLKRASVYVPTDANASYSDAGAGSYYVAHDDYVYDALNRLSSVGETNNAGAGALSQAYSYDRFGNRTINAAGTSAGINAKQFDGQGLPATNRLYAPGDWGKPDSQRSMRYDDAGNLVHDAYTGAGGRSYDAENRMTMAWSGDAVSGTYQTWYAYDAAGKRTRRNQNGQVTWEVYGFSGELLAEYAGGTLPASPQKEYGYRGGELLVTASAATRINVASANGATASASSNTPDDTYGAGLHTRPSDAIDGVRAMSEVVSGSGYWRANPLPQWLEVNFGGPKTISELDVYTVRDNYTSQSDPTATETFTLYGATAYSLQYWDNGAWQNIAGAGVMGNNLVWRKFTFPAISTQKIRLTVTGTADGVARITELEAYAPDDVAAQLSTFVTSFYTSILNRQPTTNELSSQVSTLTSAVSQGQTAFFNAASGLGQSLFLSQEYANRGRTDHEFVEDLYVAFAGREPDASGWAAWEAGVPSQGRAANIYGFSSSGNGEWAARSNSQYAAAVAAQGGGVNWLVSDHLGTPRMMVDQTGSLGGIKRRDYLPFGEELFAGTGGRTQTQGYGQADNVRQHFTAKERDDETGLDYFGARYYSSTGARFTSVDPFNLLLNRMREANDPDSQIAFLEYLAQPENWNKYVYVFNNPLRHVDPDGRQGQDLERIASQALTNNLIEFTTSITLAQRVAVSVTRTALEWAFGPQTEVVPGRLAAHEAKFAQEITQFTQSTFIGQSEKNQPGIDGVLTAPANYTNIRGVASLTETSRNNPRVLIDLAQDKETSAKKAGYNNVDLYVKATGLDSKTVVEYVNRGPAITNIASGGTIRSINIFTNDAKVVKVVGKSVSVCDNKGKCQ